tara:strand:- start:776 stop:1423 length:648 start_codon:yes stop_codon:yes gene_type:complete
MAFNTGLFFAHDTGIVDSGANPLGSIGSYKTAAAIQAMVDADTAAVIDCGGASHCMIVPLLKANTETDGSGSNAPDIQIHGVIGHGEPSQTHFAERGRLVYNLGKVQAASVGSGTQSAQSTQLVETTEAGVTFAHFADAGAATQTTETHELFVLAEALQGTAGNSVHMGDTDLDDANVGYVQVAGISIFQQLILTFNIRSANTDTKANALVCLKY